MDAVKPPETVPTEEAPLKPAPPADIADLMCLVTQIQEYIRKQGADGETWAEHAARTAGIPLHGIILYTLTLWTRRVQGGDKPGGR